MRGRLIKFGVANKQKFRSEAKHNFYSLQKSSKLRQTIPCYDHRFEPSPQPCRCKMGKKRARDAEAQDSNPAVDKMDQDSSSDDDDVRGAILFFCAHGLVSILSIEQVWLTFYSLVGIGNRRT